MDPSEAAASAPLAHMVQEAVYGAESVVESVAEAVAEAVSTATSEPSSAILKNAMARSAYAAHTSVSYLAWAFGLYFLRLIGWVCYGIPTYMLGLLGRTINISLQFSSL